MASKGHKYGETSLSEFVGTKRTSQGRKCADSGADCCAKSIFGLCMEEKLAKQGGQVCCVVPFRFCSTCHPAEICACVCICVQSFCHQPITRAKECCSSGAAKRAAKEETIGRLHAVDMDKIDAFGDIFDAYDKDKSGYLEFHKTGKNKQGPVQGEFREFLDNVPHLNLTETETNLLIDDLDKNHDGKISRNEFMAFMKHEHDIEQHLYCGAFATEMTRSMMGQGDATLAVLGCCGCCCCWDTCW